MIYILLISSDKYLSYVNFWSVCPTPLFNTGFWENQETANSGCDPEFWRKHEQFSSRD